MPRNHLLPTLHSLSIRTVRGTRAAVQAAAFWAGVLLPLGHLSVLLLLHLGRGGSLDLLVKLVAANAILCVLGHGHDPGGDADGGR